MDRAVPRALMAIAAATLTLCAAAAAQGVRPLEAWPPTSLALLHSSRFWEAHERGDLAQAALKKLVAARPDSPQALVELGELDLRINDFADAAAVDRVLTGRFGGSSEAARDFSLAYRTATRDRLRFASIRRLVEIGRTGEVRAALDGLFPHGAPGGSLGLDYYSLLASTPHGLASAYDGVRHLAALHPDDARYQYALAHLMLRQRETQLAGLALLERLAARDDIRTDEVDSALASGLKRVGAERAPAPILDAYLTRHPNDADVAELRAVQRRALEERGLRSDAERSTVLPDLQQRLARELAAPAPSSEARPGARLWLERSVASLRARHERLAAAELRAALALSRGEYESEIDISKELEAQGGAGEAGELLSLATQLAPSSRWLFETEIRWLLAHGRMDEAIERLETRKTDRRWSSAARDQLLASALEQRATRQAEAGRDAAAIADLETALRLSPGDPWMRYRLAELYASTKDFEGGRRLMQEGVAQVPHDDEMRYAQALYLSSLEDYAAAFAAVDGIEPQHRSSEMNALHDRLRVARARATARRLETAGDVAGARAALLEAEPIARHGVDRAAELAYSWIELHDVPHGVGLVEPYVTGPPAPGAATLVIWAHVLNSADDDARLVDVLARLRADPTLAPADRADLDRLQRALDLRTVRTLVRTKRFTAAERRLDALLAQYPDDRGLRTARADLDLAAGRVRAARDRYAALAAEDPDDLDTRLSYVRALTECGDRVHAQAQLEAVEEKIPAGDDELHINLARRQLALGDAAKALRTLAPLLALPAPRSDVLMLAGRAELALRRFALARSDFDRAAELADPDDALAARRESEVLAARLESNVTTGMMVRHQPGSPGMSQIDVLTLPSTWLIAANYESRFTAHADAVWLDAGHWSGVQLIGTLPTGALAQERYTDDRQTGVSPGVAYQTDSFSADLGTTPLGFLLTNLVGGIEWTPRWHSTDLTFGVSRRAATSSELSYSGMRDPITGAAWGGVVQSGPYAGFGIYRENYDVSGSLQYYDLAGTHVPSNQFAGARLSGSAKFLSLENLKADAGVTLNYWSYQHNLSNYTYGSGGYYSPRSYLSLAVPVQMDAQHAGWVYRARAAISYTVSEVDTAPFYPEDAQLQAFAARTSLPAGYSSPYFSGYHSTGFGFSAYAAAERPITHSLVAGFMLDIDRTDFYHPTTIAIYVRHVFGTRATRTVAPPSPAYPYNR
jgi:predicted Zn-dependent protease